MADEILGWKPPLIHDESMGRSRVATQEDIDRMQRDLAVLGRLFGRVEREAQIVRHSLTASLPT